MEATLMIQAKLATYQIDHQCISHHICGLKKNCSSGILTIGTAVKGGLKNQAKSGPMTPLINTPQCHHFI